MTDASPRFRSVLDGFPAYQPGRTPVSSDGKTHKLSSNESPFAPLPSVVDVITEAARSVNRYPDNAAEALIEAIAAKFGVPPQHVAVGCGSVGVAQQLLEAVGEPGAEVMYAWRSFEAYPILAGLSAAVRMTMLPFSVNSIAQAAAIASLVAEDELFERVELTVKERTRVREALIADGWTVPATEANFVWMQLGEHTADFAAACFDEGIAVRPF